MKLGSLFDGSGGFPLAGVLHGVEPVWASEIEPYPLKVTAARFPRMKQLGDVTKINGAEIEPVDVITFGSPCQDLSVAGKQAGIHDGERSSLFFEAIRMIREMRGATNGKHPRFAVWENVPGAFSSNKGKDFRAVLQALCEVCGETVPVPEPPKGKWEKAGCIVGDGYSIAWRVYDAQYWGVPQRRKRIYLVADFGGERAGEILFERESVLGDSAESGEAREGVAHNAAGSAGRGGHAFDITGVKSNSMKSPAHDNCFRESQVSRSLDTFVGSPECNQGGTCVVYDSRENDNRTAAIVESCYAFHLQQDPIGGSISPCIGGQHQATVGVFMGGQSARAGSIAYDETVSPTLRASESGSNQVPDIVYPEKVRTLTARHDSSPCVDRGYNVICYEGDGNTRAHIEYDLSPCMKKIHPNGVVYPITTGALCANTHPGSYTGQDAFNDMLPVYRKERRYVVRRLTPLEYCRLQGFPDWWEDGVTGSDSARYKMWGNGIALPCAVDVLGRIAKEDACNT